MKNDYKYPEFKDWVWKSFSQPSKKIDINNFVKVNLERERNFHVGSDSKVRGSKVVFATALIAHNISCGGEIAIHKDIMRSFDTKDNHPLRQRLITEAMRTLEVAFYLDGILPEHVNIRLHVDVNNELKFKSGQYKEELVGMIMGQGYTSYKDILDKKFDDHSRIVFWKPDSWAATSVADRRT